MFEIKPEADGRLFLIGRFDAAQEKMAMKILYALEGPTELDCRDLKYISSSGLGVLFAAQRRLVDAGASLRLSHLRPHILELFKLAGFDKILEIVE